MLFVFWLHYTQACNVRRRRRILADVMGKYSLKARCFARIKLFNYYALLINKAAGKYEENHKRVFEGFARLREFLRLAAMKKRYHQWWNQCVRERNAEVAERYRYIQLTYPVLTRWHVWAHKEAHDRRMELVARENQQALFQMLEEADEDVRTLLELEERKKQREKEALEQQAEEAKRQKREKAKEAMQVRSRAPAAIGSDLL